MRILKYIFLLLLLAAFAAAIFLATQKGEYDITTRMFIKTPKNVVFQYIDDYRNWQGWFHRQYDPEFTFPAYTGGQGGSFSYSSDLGSGTYATITSVGTDSILQATTIDGNQGRVWWRLKDSAAGTQVTLRRTGKMDFADKVRATLEGGPEYVMHKRQREMLTELGHAMNREINRYKIRIDGISIRPTTHYIGYEITSTLDNAPKNIRLLMAKLTQFFGRNKIPMAGKPFVLYEYWNTKTGTAKFRVCGPLTQEVHIAPESDMVSGKFESFRAFKTTMTGDHSHLRRAWDATFQKMARENINPVLGLPYLEIYHTGKLQTKSPAGWVTEIYVPIGQPAVPKPAVTPPVARKPKPAAQPETPAEELSIP